MLLGILGASSLENLLTGKSTNSTGECLDGLKVQFFFRKKKKKHKKKRLCRHEKNYYYFYKSNIPVIDLIVGSKNVIKL